MNNVYKASSDEFKSTTICINRVVKVIKGGRRFRFVALVVSGNGKGVVGFGIGKGLEVAAAVSRAELASKKNLLRFPIINSTIPHETHGYYKGSKISFFPATKGTGIKVGGCARVVCELSGVENIMAKYYRRNSKHNSIKAALVALSKLRDPIRIARDRGVSLDKVFNG